MTKAIMMMYLAKVAMMLMASLVTMFIFHIGVFPPAATATYSYEGARHPATLVGWIYLE